MYERLGVVGAGAALERGGGLGSASFIADKVGKGRDSSCCSRFVGGKGTIFCTGGAEIPYAVVTLCP